MISLSITDKSHTSVRVQIDDPKNPESNYYKFVYIFSQNGTTILRYTLESGYVTYPFTMMFLNHGALGNNWFSPNTSYSVYVDCYGEDGIDQLGPIRFTTDTIAAPSGSIAPYLYPTVKNQGTVGNCVAMALSSAMELLKGKETDILEHYSVSYIYGSDHGSDEWMNFEEAVELCEAYGSPRWELVTTEFPDSNYKGISVELFNQAEPLAISNAQKQAFTGHQNIDFYDCAAVADAIQSHGCFMFTFRIPNNFNSIPVTGIVPQPANGYRGDNHAMLLIGLTTINGKPHWIAQNSWGIHWGKNGLCYVPYDWGCGIQSPQNSKNVDSTCGWTLDCYSIWNGNVSAGNPSAPSGLAGTQNRKDLSATVNWSPLGTETAVLLYARKRGTNSWWPKPEYGSVFHGLSGQISFDSDKTIYEVMAIAVKNDLLSSQTQPINLSINALELWSWLISNGTATVAQTVAAYTAVTSHGKTTDFSWRVWNDLVAKIQEAIIAAGKSWDNSSGYGTYSATKMTENDKILTAKRFNAARYNIGRIYSTGLSEVHSGDRVYGSYFIALAKKLNEFIETI